MQGAGIDVQECSREVLEVVPLVMRFIRAEMRRHRASDLSVPQFRSLAFIDRNAGTSLGELAEHLGLTPPSTSKLVDGLEKRELAQRRDSPQDRRRLTLSLTPAGQRILETARSGTQQSLAVLLAGLPAADRRAVAQAMPALRRTFGR